MLTSVNKINVGLTPNDRQTFIQHVIGRLQTSRPTIYIYIYQSQPLCAVFDPH